MIKPVGTKIIVERLPDEVKSSGGLIIPDVAQHTHSKRDIARGLVVAKGPGKKLKNGGVKPIDIEIGEVIIFDFFKCIKIPYDGRHFIATREEDVLCVVGLEN